MTPRVFPADGVAQKFTDHRDATFPRCARGLLSRQACPEKVKTGIRQLAGQVRRHRREVSPPEPRAKGGGRGGRRQRSEPIKKLRLHEQQTPRPLQPLWTRPCGPIKSRGGTRQPIECGASRHRRAGGRLHRLRQLGLEPDHTARIVLGIRQWLPRRHIQPCEIPRVVAPDRQHVRGWAEIIRGIGQQDATRSKGRDQAPAAFHRQADIKHAARGDRRQVPCNTSGV